MSPPPKSHDPEKGAGPSLLLRKIDPAKEYPDTDMPANTGLLLTTHVTLKTIEAGSIIGIALAPLGYLLSKDKQRSFYKTVFKYSGRGAFLGIPLGIGMVVGKSYSMDGSGVDDRAYRLKNNPGQRRTDEFALSGAMGGALSGLVAGMVPGALPARIWNGAAFGVAMGIAAHVATMPPSQGNGKKSLGDQAKEAAEKMR